MQGRDAASGNSGGDERDRELVAACMRKEPTALQELFARYGSLFHAVAIQTLQKHPVCCTTTELLLELWEHPEKVLARFARYRGPPKPWLARVARNHFLKMLQSPRVDWPSHGRVYELPDDELLPERTSRPDRTALVNRLLEHLDARDRWMIEARCGVGRFDRQMPVAEIARQLNWSVWKVYHHVRKLLAQLRSASSGIEE